MNYEKTIASQASSVLIFDARKSHIWRESCHPCSQVLVCVQTKFLSFISLHHSQMAFGEKLEHEVTDDAASPAGAASAAGTWPLVRLQQFAEKAAEEKASLIRKRRGDQALQVSCKCPVSM